MDGKTKFERAITTKAKAQMRQMQKQTEDAGEREEERFETV